MALTAICVGIKPGAASLTDAYTVAGDFSGKVIACNQSAVPTSIRISLAPGGVADDPKQYIAYDLPIAANDVYDESFDAPNGLVVRVYNTLATVSFTVTGLARS